MTKKPIIIAERLARNVIPDLGNRPLYVIQPRDDGRVSSALLGGSKGCYYPNLDVAMKPELEALGEWRGPGVCVIADVQAFYQAGLFEYDAERRAVGVILHELCHWLDKPERENIPKPAEAYDRFYQFYESPPQRKSQFPVALLGHSESFQRLACHILYRANHGGGYCLSAHHLAIGSHYAGLEYLPTAHEFIECLNEEVRELSHLPLREVAATEQPAEFVKLWDRVLSRYVSSPTLLGPNHAKSRSKDPSRRSTQLVAACR